MSHQNLLSQNLLVELFVEELPPKALNKLGLPLNPEVVADRLLGNAQEALTRGHA